jgi:selenocysteine-specific elongation factor
VIPVSAVTGHNLPDLRDALQSLLAMLPAEEDTGRPRLWVDRSFTIRGAGTVVTGTLRHGSLAVDDEVVLAPGARPARVRGLQSLGRQLTRSAPGGRVAVNLVGLSRADVQRGDAVVRPDQWSDVRSLDAWVRALPDRSISGRGDWHLHCGSGEWRVELRVLGRKAIEGGEAGYVRIKLPDPIPVAPGDRILLRESGRQATVGGGIVLDVAPAPARSRLDRTNRVPRIERRLECLGAGDRAGLIVLSAQSVGFVPRRDVMALAGLGPAEAGGLVDQRLVALGDVYVEAGQAEQWRHAAVESVRAEHERRPMERGVPKDVPVRAAIRAGCPSAIAARLVADAVARHDLVPDGVRVRLPSHRVQFDARQTAAAEQLIKLLDSGGFTPPDFATAVAEANATDVVAELEASGRIQRIAANLATTAQVLDRAHAQLWDAYLREGPLTASQARDALATTRKYILPLLATLDQRGCTRRQGDLRIVNDVAHHV